ncbi:SMI1/KNR4 family protein [Phragmitibacter flavus]|uniref:SMI1/KNR4 family protein n=1 Tax=Phragmitibacter flavus TaxID=2576071 RepID=UPI00140B42C5|nr:SMI1/KNR4 family protein [Phragmitibacter flavus]
MKPSDFPNLVDCGWSPKDKPANNDEVARLESKIGVSLPPEYRDFIAFIGPGFLDGWVPCSYPTPFGSHGLTSLHSIIEVEELLDSLIVPRNMICIGSGDFGAFTCLSVCGLDRGAIYSLDGEMNYYKDIADPQQFYSNSPNAIEFYRLRDEDQLPPRPCGYDNCYHITDSFANFLKALQSSTIDD